MKLINKPSGLKKIDFCGYHSLHTLERKCKLLLKYSTLPLDVREASQENHLKPLVLEDCR